MLPDSLRRAGRREAMVQALHNMDTGVEGVKGNRQQFWIMAPRAQAARKASDA